MTPSPASPVEESETGAEPPRPDPAEEIARLKGAALILIDAVEHVRHAGGMGFDGKRFDEQIKIARAALGGSSPDRGDGK